jgi:hypothetical protein
MSSRYWAGITRTRWATPLLCVTLGFAAGILCSLGSTSKDGLLLPLSVNNTDSTNSAITDVQQASVQPNDSWPVSRYPHATLASTSHVANMSMFRMLCVKRLSSTAYIL